jgi:hypothetical protein
MMIMIYNTWQIRNRIQDHEIGALHQSGQELLWHVLIASMLIVTMVALYMIMVASYIVYDE